jgi:hypothetical protein
MILCTHQEAPPFGRGEGKFRGVVPRVPNKYRSVIHADLNTCIGVAERTPVPAGLERIDCFVRVNHHGPFCLVLARPSLKLEAITRRYLYASEAVQEHPILGTWLDLPELP